MNPDIRIERAAASHSEALQSLFEGSQTGCYCQWWHFSGDKNDWQLRCATGTENREDMQRHLSVLAPQMHGFVALVDARAVGWLKLTPSNEISKLYEQRLYKGLDCFAGDRSGAFTVGCVLVAEEFRRQGIARALLTAAIAWARSTGARAIEAFPRRAQLQRSSDLWLGPLDLYEQLGFQTVHPFEPYPVLRLDLSE